MTGDPCGNLSPGLAAICRGERADMPHEKRLAYLWRWYHAGRVNADALEAAGVPRAEIPDRGLGDKIERVTRATGVKRVVSAVSKATGIPCRCGELQQALNQAFPSRDAGPSEAG